MSATTRPPLAGPGRPPAEHPLAHAWTYWRRVAEDEDSKGLRRVAECYRRLAAHAERQCRALHDGACQQVPA